MVAGQADAQEGPRVGDVLEGRYRLTAVLGQGGMGTVFAAETVDGAEKVAIKTLVSSLGDQVEFVERLLREARTAAAIDSPHVTRVLATGTLEGGLPYVVMELLEGETLDAYARANAPLPIARVVDLVLEVCEGLAPAHAIGVVHRDLKPSNLFLARGASGAPLVKILDFGISKASALALPGELPTLTETGAMLGSPQYMSPEQLRSARRVDARSDLFSLGVVLHKLASGKLPFQADSLAAYVAMVAADPPKPLRADRPDAPAGLESVVLRCLQKSPARRYPGVGALATALAPFASDEGRARAERIGDGQELEAITADDVPPPSELPTLPLDPARGSGPRPASRSLRGIAIAVVGTALVLGGAAAVLGRRGAAPAEPSPSADVAARDPATAPAPPPTAASSAASVAGAPDVVHVSIRLDPPQASLEMDGAPVSSPLSVARGSRHTIVARARGFVVETQEIAPDADAELEVTLKRVRGAAARSTATAEPPKPRLKPLMEQTL